MINNFFIADFRELVNLMINLDICFRKTGRFHKKTSQKDSLKKEFFDSNVPV